MANNAERRLVKDLKKMQDETNDQSITAIPDGDNLFKWDAIIFGPDDTEWEGGVFKLKMSFTE
jgi:ubiquitin-conjugating enzyme E2 A